MKRPKKNIRLFLLFILVSAISAPGEVTPSKEAFIRVPLVSQYLVKKVVYPDGNYAEFFYTVSGTQNIRTVTDVKP
ncbi:MAG: hypothetical protein GY795_18690 [Desulfobacterales bacterium]|nr:hypothetical protein [Desulfobacterales bacterium]